MKTSLSRERVWLYARIGGAFWLLSVIGDLVSYPETIGIRMLNDGWRCLYVTAVNFVLFEFTVPFIRLTVKRILAGIVLLFLYMMAYSFGLYAWRMIGIGLGIFTSLIPFKSTSEGLESQMAFSVGSVLFFGIVRYTHDFRKLKETAQQLQLEKQAAELNYLKAQTNPHFLFNTLNNIYSLARDKSDLAPESILRLSQLLRYMLYETGGAYVAIEQELKVINDYIALEKIRYDDSLRVNFNYDVEDMKQALPPLLLIPLVENAFKHGVSETRDEPFVAIHLQVKNRRLSLTVTNSVDGFADEPLLRERIGLSNLRRQLELLYSDYKLTTEPGQSTFRASLTINLASHNHV